jgi:glycogen(starch) synthase
LLLDYAYAPWTIRDTIEDIGLRPVGVTGRLNILLVHVWFWPHVGGGDRHVELLGRELVAKGHKVTVWCADVPEHNEREFSRHGISVVRIPAISVLGGVDPVVSVRNLDMSDFDIVHLHDTLPILIRKTALKASKMGIPIVTTYHNDYVKSTFIGRLIKRMRWSLQGNRTLSSSEIIIALRPYFGDLLRSKGAKGEIRIIPTGFEPPHDSRRRPKEAPKGPFLLYLSRLTKQKGVDILLDAWGSMDDNERNGHGLIVAGTGPMEQDVIDASNSPSESGLHHLGLVDEEEKSWLLENASGLVLPSRFEGLPAILLEGAWTGLPVAMADVNGLGDFVEKGGFGITFQSNSSMQCKLAMSRLSMAEDEQKNSWSKNGRNLAEMYLWPNVADKIEAAYNDAVNK